MNNKCNNAENKIEEPDWVIRGIFDCDGSIVFHTEGLYKHNMLELELNLSINAQQAKYFINLIAIYLIENNIIIEEEAIIEDIFTSPIFLKRCKAIYGEDNLGQRADFLRIIFPDTNFKFPWEDGCEEMYKNQI